MTKFQQIINGQVVSLSNGHMPQFQIGLDASKPSTPGKGDMYQALDTLKEYQCFVPGIWVCTSSPSEIRYQNNSVVADNFMVVIQTGLVGSSILTAVAGNSITMNTGNTNTGSLSFIKNTLTDNLSLNFPYFLNFKIGAIQDGTPAGGTTCVTQIGLNSDFGSFRPANGRKACFIQMNDGTWITETSDNAGTAYTDTAIATPATGSNLSILALSNLCVFYVNGAVVATHTTNLPLSSHAMYFGFGICVLNAAMTVARTLTITSVGYRKVQ